MRIFDSHCHLHDERLDSIRDEAMAKAREAGVRGFFDCGATPEGWEAVLSLSERNEDVIPAFGLHPWYIHLAREDWQDLLLSYLERTPSAIGEIGLDNAVDDTPMEIQEDVFRVQLEIAVDLGLPVNVHCRKAWEQLVRVMKRAWKKGAPFVIHSFSGTIDTINPLAELGAYFSYSGSLTRRHNTRAHKTLPRVPRDRLLVETDAPDIPPEIDSYIDFESPNEPANIVYVIRKAALLLGMKEEDVASLTWENACRALDPVLKKRVFSA